MAELQLLKSITRQERQDMEIQMFLKKKNQSRKWLLQDMDEELDVAQALGLCTVHVAMKRPRKGRSVDEERTSSFLATPSNSSWPPCCLSAKPRFED